MLTIREWCIAPKRFDDFDEVGFPTAIKATDPGRRLRGQAQMTEIGIEDAMQPELVFTFADERLELVAKRGRVSDLTDAIVLERVLGWVILEDVAIVDRCAHPRPLPLTGTIGTAR
jgi:hypothetical protein